MAAVPQSRKRKFGNRQGPKQHSWDEGWAEKEYNNVKQTDKMKACDQVIDILTKEHVENGLSAYTFCTLVHFLCLAGLDGRLLQFALEPGLQTGKYQRKLDVALGLKKKGATDYILKIPGYDKRAGHRTEIPMTSRCPLEILREEVDNSNETWDKIESQVVDLGEHTHNFNNHILVKGKSAEERKRIVPYALSE